MKLGVKYINASTSKDVNDDRRIACHFFGRFLG